MAEQAATRVAQPAAASHAGSLLLQRKCACGNHASGGGECEGCKKKLQRKSHAGVSGGVPPLVHEVLGAPGRPLDAATRAWMEPRFGHDFSGVRVHTDGAAAESARSVGALAYAVGQHVVFGQQQYAPHTPAGRHLLAHELAHTIQDPGSGGLHPSLELGSPGDANEVAADRAADAVTRGDKVTVAPAGGGLVRRQLADECTASPGQNLNERVVKCPKDGDYRVTLTLSDKPAQPDTRFTVNPGWNNQEIWLDIGICRGGTAVTITPRVDLPKAVGEAVANMVGGSPLLKGVSITPGLTFTIVQNESFTFTVGPSVTIDQKGASSVGVGAEVKTKDVDIKADVTYDTRNKGGFLNLTFSAGSKQPTVNCSKQGRQYAVFTCERISHVAAVPPVPEQTKPVDETRYVFFEYASDKFRHDLPLPVKDVQDLTGQGYKIVSIQGFTSPEGPRDTRNMPKFEGNKRLADERATAAKTWLQSGDVCKGCDLSGVPAEGQGELPPKEGSRVPEREGRQMEKSAVDEFLGKAPDSKPDPLAPTDPIERAKFEKLPFNEQRERAFKAMRRAAIVFRRMVVTQEAKPGKDAHDEFESVACPSKVTDAAQKSFGINVLTTGPSVPKGSK